MLYTILWNFSISIFLLKFIAMATSGICRANVCLLGKTAIVTGANSGLGRETATNLAARGCRVIVADVADSTETINEIKQSTGNNNIQYMPIDLANLQSVRKFAENILATEERLDFLINNAGCGGFVTKTSDDILKVLQVNHIGHFLLTNLLSPILITTPHSRIVFVSSLLAFLHTLTDGLIIDPVANSHFTPSCFYGNSKIAMLATAQIFAQRLEKHGIIVSSCHPGIVKTPIYDAIFDNSVPGVTNNIYRWCTKVLVQFIAKNTVEGIQTILHCAFSDNIKSGQFYVDCSRFFQPPPISNKQFCENVWNASIRLSGLSKEEEI